MAKFEKVVNLSLAIAVPPERVWRALTTPRELGRLILGWVEMEAKPGREFQWRWTVWQDSAPRKGDFAWHGRVLDVVPGSTLVLGGNEVVVFTVKGEGGATLVTVSQGGGDPGTRIEEYRHGWEDFLIKLKTALETETARDELLLRTLVRAKSDALYRAWLTASTMSKLLPGQCKITGRQGERFEWQWKLPPWRGRRAGGVFLELEKGKRISFTWEATGFPTEVALGFQPVADGTLLSLHHTGFGGRERLRQEHLALWSRLLERARCYFYFGKKIRTK